MIQKTLNMIQNSQLALKENNYLAHTHIYVNGSGVQILTYKVEDSVQSTPVYMDKRIDLTWSPSSMQG